MDYEKIVAKLIRYGEDFDRESLKMTLPLVNINNTCFANVVLQALFHTQPLKEEFINGKFGEVLKHLDNKEFMLTLCYINMSLRIWINDTDNIEPYIPNSFIKEMRKNLPLYEWGYHHDAQETLIWVLNSFHECLSKPIIHRIEGEPKNKLDIMRVEATRQWANNYAIGNNSNNNNNNNNSNNNNSNSNNNVKEYRSIYSIILRIFGGQFLERLNCEICNEIKYNYVSFLTSELAINAETIEELLENQCNLEKLDRDNVWFCEKCKLKTQPYRRMSYWTLPEVLIISLKRFSYEKVNNEYYTKKIRTKVLYSPTEYLDMDKYLSNSLSETKYLLYAIVCHRGNLDNGHYYAYCRNLGLGIKESIWLKYNDEKVECVESLDDLVNEDAYILFYQRIDTLK